VKFELKEYQEQAATKVLSALRKGSSEYVEDGGHTAVSLSAPTGAGKTVIAAAVIERVLVGDPEAQVPGDPNAVFLWLTDDPSLNEQTRKKILEASDRLQSSHLVTLDDGFDQPEFDRGKVYFLNIQKLGKNSNLVVRKEGRRSHILSDTISQTVKSNGAHFVLVIDEAHRGTGRPASDAQTITQRLMNGNGLVVATPVILGISATPERFETAVKNGTQERVPRKVTVPVAAVRESGLLKDVLSIRYRGETQTIVTTLVRQAVAQLRTMDEAWNAYTEAENEPPVRPALVFQIPPNAKGEEVGALLDVCVEEWPELAGRNAIAHSLESHTAAEFGQHVVKYVKPQNIQDHPAIRLVLFKEALTTGWDCPRAEVMVSLRVAKDDTYIAQLIGRMVRSPLARRIESDETLNLVRLYLPNFDKDAVEAVKAKLESDDGGLATEIEINAAEAKRNKKVDATVFDIIQALPSYVVPGPVHRSQVARLHKLAALLVGDGLLAGAIQQADAFLVSVLESERARLEAGGELAALVKDAKTATVSGLDIHADGTTVTSTVNYDTDIADVNRLYAATKRRLRDGLAERYWADRVTAHGLRPTAAKILTVALSTSADVVAKVETEAADRVRQWLGSYGAAIGLLSEDKKAKYADVRAMARKPEQVTPGLPTAITMPGEAAVDGYEKHVFSDAAGVFRARLGTWEKHVIAVESALPDFVAWYRNPVGGQRSLRVPYKVGNEYGKLYPDFIVLHNDDAGEIKASIVDPRSSPR